MIFFLLKKLLKNTENSIFFSQLTFRMLASFLTSAIFFTLFAPVFIRKLKSIQFFQKVREENPKSHLKKRKTPTFGGLLIISSVLSSMFLWSNLNVKYIQYIFFSIFFYGLIGFIDDYKKIVHRNSKGLTAGWKYFWQSLLTIIMLFFLYTSNDFSNNFLKKDDISVGSSIFLFVRVMISYLIIVGMSNAVNITDGLDGLVSMPLIFVYLSFSIISILSSQNIVSSELTVNNLHNIQDYSEIAIACFAIIGSCTGFLWFNIHPAKLFMGDVGSLSLGSTMGLISVLLEKELNLLLIGGIFTVEVSSVIFQIFYFKLFHKRFYLMAPIHHHYELLGYSEPEIIFKFWIISLMFSIFGLLITW
ncbi:hypothetical protein AOE57_02160 [Candidatus Riesia pediculicola]|nr:hypothetical protein AOE57_02160 [Candidatus Riesia pediculicola]